MCLQEGRSSLDKIGLFFPFLADKSNVAEDTVRLFVSLLSFLSLAGIDPQLYLMFVSGAAFIKVYGKFFRSDPVRHQQWKIQSEMATDIKSFKLIKTSASEV